MSFCLMTGVAMMNYYKNIVESLIGPDLRKGVD
jgi:hypothetical protein